MNSVPQEVPLRNRRARNDSLSNQNVHERGDKVVVNGAKESLKSILRRYICQCGKHTGDKLAQKFLSTNRLTASYDVLVWMFIFLRVNCQTNLYMSILKEYLIKMEKKNNEDQSHQSKKYRDSKKKTLLKFIQSVKLLMTDQVDQGMIEESVAALYSKGKSRDNSLIKIRAYLKRNNFYDCLNFVDSSCSLKVPSSSAIQSKKNQKQSKQLPSDNSEVKISHCDPHEENIIEEIKMLEEDESWSQLLSSRVETRDLFYQLIHSNETDKSLRGSY